MNAIKMNADAKCMKMHTQPVYFQNTLVNGNGMLQNVFVYIKDGLTNKSYPSPKNPMVIDQEGCMYHPHVFGIQVNQPLRIENSDPVLHNIHAIPKINNAFNFAQPRQGMNSEVTFSEPEIMVRVKCDVHSWMGCYIGVLDHPFYAVTDSVGACDITGLPPGEYNIAAWHEELGSVEQKISVKEGTIGNIEFTFASKK
jgi:plastocyanin